MLKESKKTNTEDELSVLEGSRDEIKGLKRKGAKQTAQLFFSYQNDLLSHDPVS